MTNRRPTLCVVAGPNGSGKTTTTIQLLNNERRRLPEQEPLNLLTDYDEEGDL